MPYHAEKQHEYGIWIVCLISSVSFCINGNHQIILHPFITDICIVTAELFLNFLQKFSDHFVMYTADRQDLH